MQKRDPFLAGLLELHTVRDAAERRAAWRSSLAGLARACAADAVSPLDGLAPVALVDSARAAIAAGLADDVDWLSPSAAATALYELAAALPAGAEKRELGRRAAARFLDGDAGTFVALATRMALGSGKGLAGDGVRARIGVALALPPSAGVRIEPLAIALVSRRELAREWVVAMAERSLPDRRLAARLIEQAATGIASRAGQGDDAILRVLGSDAATAASDRLLADREPLVWRHVAVARGLLSPYHPPYLRSLDEGLAPDLTPTEWRRSATSLMAMVGVAPDRALRKLRDALAKGVLRRDPGAVAAFVYGLPVAAELEPEATAEALSLVLTGAPASSAAEALVEVLPCCPPGFAAAAVAEVASALGRAGVEDDDGALALRTRLAEELGRGEGRDRTVADATRDGALSFATEGAKAGFARGLEALSLAEAGFEGLAAIGGEETAGRAGAIARRAGFSALRELDVGLFEDGLLKDLLVLGGRAPEAQAARASFDSLADRVAGWVLSREEAAPVRDKIAHPTIRLRRLRTLLHVADARDDDEREPGSSVDPVSVRHATGRRLKIAHLCLRMLSSQVAPVLQRTVVATLARTLDGLVREGACDPADVLLLVARREVSARDVATVVEASRGVELPVLLQVYAEFLRATNLEERAEETDDAPVSLAPSSLPPIALGAALGRRLRAFVALAKGIPADGGHKTESLRHALLRLSRALVKAQAAGSRAELRGRSTPLTEIEDSVVALGQLVLGARRRLEDRAETAGYASLEASLASAVESDDGDVGGAAAAMAEEVAIFLPRPFAVVVADVAFAVAALPAAAAIPVVAAEAETTLPAWLPARRTLGGFWVMRALGAGAVATVLVAKRIEDRHDPTAECFALKVPSYDEAAARALTEAEFLKLFREEASALLGLPEHPNLARFVTFDLASRPKPILVMELVHGVSLDRVIRTAQLDSARAVEILDGVLGGLEAMHQKGIGHLDLKPSNVILRDGKQPVLVDFGLSGRNIRPGCATLDYGAPEVWGVTFPDHQPTPPPVDIYAFGCLAFEMMTTREIVDGESEMAIITAHVSHDGMPPHLAELATNPDARVLVELVRASIARDPRRRPTATQLREYLRRAAPSLSALPWPVSPRRA